MTQTFSDGTPVPYDGYGEDEEPDFSPRAVDLPLPSAEPDKLYRVLNRIATALETIAQNPRNAPSAPPGAPQNPGPPNGPPGAPKPAGPDTTKMSKKVYAVCMNQGWDMGDVGLRATGKNIGADSRKWSFDDLKTVLDKFTEWNV